MHATVAGDDWTLNYEIGFDWFKCSHCSVVPTCSTLTHGMLMPPVSLKGTT